MERFYHEFGPVYDENSKLIILGSFPSVKSREESFYYAHPQNRFWQLMALIYNESAVYTVEDKIKFLLRHNIALWDVVKSCLIKGSADSAIREAEINDIAGLIEKTAVKRIYLNGSQACEKYQKYVFPFTGIKGVCLPSTSSANAAYSLTRLYDKWRVISL